MEIYALIVVTYDYYRFERFVMASTNKQDLINKVNTLNSKSRDKENVFETKEYETIDIKNNWDSNFQEFDKEEIPHFWIHTTKIKQP